MRRVVAHTFVSIDGVMEAPDEWQLPTPDLSGLRRVLADPSRCGHSWPADERHAQVRRVEHARGTAGVERPPHQGRCAGRVAKLRRQPGGEPLIAGSAQLVSTKVSFGSDEIGDPVLVAAIRAAAAQARRVTRPQSWPQFRASMGDVVRPREGRCSTRTRPQRTGDAIARIRKPRAERRACRPAHSHRWSPPTSPRTRRACPTRNETPCCRGARSCPA
jgi:hypothetical protein